jgi:hypothetical protein
LKEHIGLIDERAYDVEKTEWSSMSRKEHDQML